MNDKFLIEKRDMFAIDIANLHGILKNFFSEWNGFMIAHSDKILTLDGKEHIFVRIERVNKNGFDFAEVILPENCFYLAFGFSDDELLSINKYLQNNLNKIMK